MHALPCTVCVCVGVDVQMSGGVFSRSALQVDTYCSFGILGMAVLVMSMALLCMPIAWYGYLVASVDIFAYMSVPGA